MERKYIPLVFVLISGALTVIFVFPGNMQLSMKMVIMFAVMFLFFIVGAILEKILDGFEKEIKEKEAALQKEKEEQEQRERLEQAAQEARDEAQDTQE